MNHSSRERQPLHTHAAFTKPHKLPTANLAQKAMQLVSKGSSNSFLLAEKFINQQYSMFPHHNFKKKSPKKLRCAAGTSQFFWFP
jgi:hypothetical protein